MMSITKTFYNMTFNKSPLLRHFSNKMRFPEIAIEPSANLKIEGEFHYKKNCTISLGANVFVSNVSKLLFGSNVYIGRHVELGPTQQIKIGDYTSLQDRCVLVGEIEIGRYCLFSLNVLISSGKHFFDKEPHCLIRDQDEKFLFNLNHDYGSNKVIVEDDCWIGINTVLMPGIKIGKGSIIGANSVVTKDIPPYSVAVGAPAKIVKKRLDFSPPRIISFDKPFDYPYFYSGVEISSSERRQASAFCGVATKDNFRLALNTADCKKIILRVRASKGMHTLFFKGDNQLVGENFSDVVFSLSETNDFLDFLSKANNPDSKLILQKAWVE